MTPRQEFSLTHLISTTLTNKRILVKLVDNEDDVVRLGNLQRRGKTLASPSQRDVVLKKQGGKEKHLSLGEAGGACTKAEKEKRTECAQKCMRVVRLENWFHAREQRGTVFVVVVKQGVVRL